MLDDTCEGSGGRAGCPVQWFDPWLNCMAVDKITYLMTKSNVNVILITLT